MIKLLLVSIAISTMPCQKAKLKNMAETLYVRGETVVKLDPEVRKCDDNEYNYCEVAVGNFWYVSPMSCQEIREKIVYGTKLGGIKW